MGHVVDSYRFAAGGAFDPLTLTGLLSWHDASDTGSITATGGLVDQIDDLSGNARHLKQTSTNRPTTGSLTQNGLNVLSSDGNDHMTTDAATYSLSKPVTLVYVGKAGTAGSQQTAWILRDGGSDGRIYMPSGGTINLFQGSVVSTGTSWGTTDAHIVTAVFNGASSKYAVDGAAFTTCDTGSSGFGTSLRLWSHTGAGEYWTGTFCEGFVISGEIPSGEKTDLEAYLADKWGTP